MSGHDIDFGHPRTFGNASPDVGHQVEPDVNRFDTWGVAHTRGTLRGHLVALAWFMLVAAMFLAPLFGGKSFSVVGSRQSDVYPWTAQIGPPQVPAQFDSADLSYQWQLLLQDAIDEGTLPFWSPDVCGGGAPLYPNGPSGQHLQLEPSRFAGQRYAGQPHGIAVDHNDVRCCGDGHQRLRRLG